MLVSIRIAAIWMAVCLAASIPCAARAASPVTSPAGSEIHVSPAGDDASDGSSVHMLRTISAAAERVEEWTHVHADVWEADVPNSLFVAFNPFDDPIHGPCFRPMGRTHRTGAVYLNGDWLAEAATLDEVLGPAGHLPLWFACVGPQSTTVWAQFIADKADSRDVARDPGDPFPGPFQIKGNGRQSIKGWPKQAE